MSRISKQNNKKRSKELECFLLPDAPARIKRSRKSSPKRTACRLTPGTPPTPPASKLRSWEKLQCEDPENRETQPLVLEDADTSSSAVSFNSGVPDLSPLDYTTSTLKVTSTTKTTKPPTETTEPTTKTTESTTKTTEPTTKTSEPTTKTTEPTTKTTEPEVTKGSDLENIIHRMWEELSDNEDIKDVAAYVDIDAINDFTAYQPALPGLLDKEQEEWLEREDMVSDRHLRDILPTDNMTFAWSSNPDTFTGRREDFTGTPGPTFELTDSTRPIDVFMKFFDNNLLDLIVNQTNLHANNIINKGHLKEQSRLNSWKNTDRDEMVIFFSILILQGMAPLSVENDYWKENGYLTMTRFKTLMTYNRYVIIKRLLHFSDDKTSTDRLRKIMPILNRLNEKFSRLYYPDRDIAIDESLLKWHGPLSFSQRIATKAAKVGIKTYELCESSSGYLWQFSIYTGKGQKDLTEETMPPSNMKATARIVLELIHPLLNRGHTLTMDNFYNSPLLARYLKSKGTDCFGTLRVSREFVPESIKSVTKGELRAGEIVQSYCRDLTVTVWRDTNIVSLISTFHKGEVGGKEKYGRYKYKPQVVLDYNLSLGGVDKKDQLLSAHPMERARNQVWYKKVFRRILNVTVLNAYIIFKTRFKNVTQREFRGRLVDEMIQMHKKIDPVIDPMVSTKSLMVENKFIRPILSGNHFIGAAQSKNSRCFWCKKSRSRYICKQCDVVLCILPCFEEFHTERDRPSSRCLPSQSDATNGRD